MNIKYPEFTGRKGSKCFFTYNKNFFEENKQKACELITFHTLFLFGHKIDDTTNYSQVIIPTEHGFHIVELHKCMKLLLDNKLNHRIFHLPSDHDTKLFNTFKGKCFVTDHLLNRKDKPAFETKDDHKFYPVMYDTYKSKIYKAKHILSEDHDSDAEDFLVGEQLTYYEYDCEPHGDEDECILCYDHTIDINTTNFTLPKKEINKLNNADSKKLYSSKYESVTLNNLIFDFKNYKFDILIKGNKAIITFNKNAIGGYRHASLYSGAVFEVIHAVPGTLKYVSTTYVNTVNILFVYNEDDEDIIVVSEYKAIDAL